MPFTTSRPFHLILTNVLKRFGRTPQHKLRPSSTLTNTQSKLVPSNLHWSHLRPTQYRFRYAWLAGGISFSIVLAGIVHATHGRRRSPSLIDIVTETNTRSNTIGPDFPGAIVALQKQFDPTMVSTDPQELYAYAQSSYSQTPGRLSVFETIHPAALLIVEFCIQGCHMLSSSMCRARKTW